MSLWRTMVHSSPSTLTSVPEYLLVRTLSPTLTVILTSLPSTTPPGPTAMTCATCGFSFALPVSVSLVGFLMFGNLLRECGCLDRLSETAQNTLANLITLLLGITISFSMRAEQFVNRNTLIIMGLGLVAFVFDSIAGVMFAKLLNLFSKKKVNPMVGAAGISAFPMSARVIQKMGLEADPQNHLLMHAVGANVAGQIASVLAGGMILNLVPQLLK